MNRFLILFISILFIKFLLLNFIIEKFDLNLESDTELPYKSAFDKTLPVYYNQVDYLPKNQIKCCLIQNKYIPDSSQLFGGSFKYKFKKLENEMCDLKKYRLDNNTQLFIDGYNKWSNKQCNENNKYLGSCRNVNKECIDFVDKSYCDKYKMTWSKKTCQDPLDFIWIDRVGFKKPVPSNDGSYVMFDKKSELAK